MAKQKAVTMKLTDELRYACEYFMRTQGRNNYSDVLKGNVLTAYNKIPDDRKTKHEAACDEMWANEKEF